MPERKNIGIIGYGRFGRTLARLLKDEGTLYICDPRTILERDLPDNVKKVDRVRDLYEKTRIIFYTVPISDFEAVIQDHRQYYDGHLLLDTCSVKSYPDQVFQKHLKRSNARAILTHPLFGPDSSRNGFRGLPIVISNHSAMITEYQYWKKFFKLKGLDVIEMSPDRHDELAARSQGITHFVGRLLKEVKFKPTKIDTVGADRLHEITDQTCNDTWELFQSLQTYNPYTKAMRQQLGQAYQKIDQLLLKDHKMNNKKVYGIQGGPASFNEQAIMDYFKKHKLSKKQNSIKYLYTTDKVLDALEHGEIDYGLFAIQNSIGGMVDESIEAMGQYKFKIKEKLKIKIRHYLMKKKESSRSDINVIMAHPQVLMQCMHNLKKRYSKMELKSGEGDLIDTATAARALSDGKLSKNIAILGSKRISQIHGLEIIDEDLQDNLHDERLNFTDFLLVE